ncbi:oligosaccharide flippase family protein [Flavobacterium laiguense]|uniref:Uncharacterized protein n=1 Tax=Flavobacterium laiguense TaxID=2169409 RepID=A0A2U1JXH2_9FLAO|nr:polysaccharide biosynthesis C-terminal domain-containing protein [Flavobacterium laiguense]PWA09910.1 hypothetical protein DB891_06990 [Flavobacterium laiguense]
MISRDIIYYGLIKGITVLYWLIIIKLSSIYLDPESFGNFSIAFSISTYIAIVLSGWQSSAALRFYHEVDSKLIYYNVLLKTLFKPFLLFLSIGVLASLLSYFYMSDDFFWIVIAIIPLSILYGLFLLIVPIVRIKRDLKFYLRLLLIQSVTLIGTVIPLLRIFGWVGVILAFVVSYFVVLLYFVIIKINQFHSIWYVKTNTKLVSQMMSYGWPVVLIGAFSQLLSSIDQIVLKYNGYNNEVGIYAANYNIAEKSVFAFLAIFVSAFTPILYKNINSKNFDLLLQIRKGVSQFLLFALPIVVLLAIFSRTISAVFLDKKYVEGHWIIPIIAFSGIFVGIASFYSEVLTVAKKTKLLAALYGVAMMVNIVLNIIFIPRFGILAAVSATFSAYFVLLVLVCVFASRNNNVNLST